LIEPRRQTNAARDGIDFGDDVAVIGKNEVRPDDQWQVIAKFFAPRKFHELCRLSIVEIARNPFRLFSFYAELIELIASTLKDEEAMTELLKLPRKFFVNRERFGRKQPIFVGEKSFGRKGASNRIQFVDNGELRLKSRTLRGNKIVSHLTPGA
jgi:hypothetical protein